jgi:hypothetical protein
VVSAPSFWISSLPWFSSTNHNAPSCQLFKTCPFALLFRFLLFKQRVKTRVGQFSLLKWTSSPGFDTKLFFCDVLWVQVWAQFFKILNCMVPILAHFFKFKNFWAWFKNQVWFHVHIIHPSRLSVVEVQNFIIN